MQPNEPCHGSMQQQQLLNYRMSRMQSEVYVELYMSYNPDVHM